jgi:hypothetical protein
MDAAREECDETGRDREEQEADDPETGADDCEQDGSECEGDGADGEHGSTPPPARPERAAARAPSSSADGVMPRIGARPTPSFATSLRYSPVWKSGRAANQRTIAPATATASFFSALVSTVAASAGS